LYRVIQSLLKSSSKALQLSLNLRFFAIIAKEAVLKGAKKPQRQWVLDLALGPNFN